LSEPQVEKNTNNTTARLTTEDILNKYRSKYPDIALQSVGGSYSRGGSHTTTAEVRNVNNPEDKRKIEKEIAQALHAGNLFISPPPDAPNAPAPPLADGIFLVVEEQPAPVGGYEAFYKYIGENIQYPQQARLQGIEGKVFVQFVVYNDGSIADVQVLKGIGAGCDAEAVKVIVNAPKWNPGKQDGKPVNVRMSVPIAFKLN
jgi:TonB family protein